MNLTTYSAAFKEETIRKTLQHGTRTVADMAQELNMSVHTLKNWIRDSKVAHLRPSSSQEKPAHQWTTAQRLQALSTPIVCPRSSAMPGVVDEEYSLTSWSLCARSWRPLAGRPPIHRSCASCVRNSPVGVATWLVRTRRYRRRRPCRCCKKIPGAVGGREQMTPLHSAEKLWH